MSDEAQYENALALNSMLLEYRLESVLGAGGFGMTYLGWDTNLEKHVAIKEYLPTDLAVRALDSSVVPVDTESEFNYKWGLDRFIQEARTLARFSHPNIVRVNRFFEANGTSYMVMDYEAGESLHQHLKRVPMPDEAALKKIMMPILDGLEAIHRAGFLHRDIKPSNVFLRENGAPLLIDFGSARMSTGHISKNLRSIVSPGYAPLEQYMREGHQGPWSDIYALSGVLYRAVTGGHPPDAVKRMKNDQVPAALAGARSRYDERFLRAIEWGLKLNEKVRPRSIAEWRELFSGRAPMSALNRGGVEETPLTGKAPAPDHRAHRPGKPARSRWLRRGAYMAAAAVLLALWWTQHDAGRAIQKPDSPPAAPDAKADAAGVSDAVAAERAEPPAAPSSPSVDNSASDPRPAQLPGPGASASPEPDIPAALKQEFAAADASGDGFLSPAEVRGRFPAVERNFPVVDADRDGRISLDELWQFRRKTFAGKPPR